MRPIQEIHFFGQQFVLHKFGIGIGNGLQMDIAAKVMILPQAARDLDDLVREGPDPLKIETDAAIPGECLAGELQENARIALVRGAHGAHSAPSCKRTKRSTVIVPPARLA